jgi:hypothetical protein
MQFAHPVMKLSRGAAAQVLGFRPNGKLSLHWDMRSRFLPLRGHQGTCSRCQQSAVSAPIGHEARGSTVARGLTVYIVQEAMCRLCLIWTRNRMLS